MNFSIKATSPIIGNSPDTMSSICAATTSATDDEDKISCTISFVLKTTVKNMVMQNRREVQNDA